MIRVTIWNEFVHEKKDEAVRAIYPDGIHGALRAFLSKNEDMVIRTATLEEPENGLSQAVLDATDVLIWWGHVAHDQVADATVDRIQERVQAGMGFIALHSAHASKPFSRLMGTTTLRLRWHEDNLMERFWVIDQAHPIAAGLGDYFEVSAEETYGEPFGIPAPEELVFMSWYPSGEVFRSGACWHRGQGRIFYFQPGHETCRAYYDENVQKVITNAVRWAYNPAPRKNITGWTKPLGDTK